MVDNEVLLTDNHSRKRVFSSVGRAADFNKRLVISDLHEKDNPHGAIMRKLIIRMA